MDHPDRFAATLQRAPEASRVAGARRLRAIVLGIAALVACRGARTSPPAHADPVEPGLVDHHVHILGPGLVRDWKSLGAAFSRPDEAYGSVDGWFMASGDAPEEQVLHGALLVPMAHLYGNEEFRSALGFSLEEEQARVRAENEHVAREARRRPGCTRALAAVDLLRPYALAELERMHREHGVAGAKVHLASAGFDFRDEAHLATLERVAGWVEQEGLALLLHLDPQRRGVETEDVTHLLEHALGPHPRLTVVIAHLGGSGGFGPWTQAVLATLTRWLADERARGQACPGFFVDLSAVPMLRESEGVPPSSEAEIAALAPALRALGLERVLFGSDFPVFDPREHARFLRERCGLTDGEAEQILAQRLFR